MQSNLPHSFFVLINLLLKHIQSILLESWIKLKRSLKAWSKVSRWTRISIQEIVAILNGFLRSCLYYLNEFLMLKLLRSHLLLILLLQAQKNLHYLHLLRVKLGKATLLLGLTCNEWLRLKIITHRLMSPWIWVSASIFAVNLVIQVFHIWFRV